MRARAPGKVVLSGAYAVLEGATALVAAVDRYVLADTDRICEHVTPEVRQALLERTERVAPAEHSRESSSGSGAVRAAPSPQAPPWFDASALRERDRANGALRDRKLGLGSSAAILVASLAALELSREPTLDATSLGQRLLPEALRAHRIAQGGGSGIDVLASVRGGIQRCTLGADHSLSFRSVVLPAGIVVEIWNGAEEVSTKTMLERTRSLRDTDTDNDRYRAIMDDLKAASADAAFAVDAAEGAPFIAALRRQREALSKLGAAAGTAIVPESLDPSDRLAREGGAVVIPSGAGGTEVVLWMGPQPSGPDVQRALARVGLVRLDATIGAQGVHPDPVAPL